MNSVDDWKQVVRRNKLLGMWAAEKLGMTGQKAEAYSNALAVDAVDPERSDMLSKIRKDFDAAGVVQSDEQIVQVMDDLMLEAGKLEPTAGGGGPAEGALAVCSRANSRNEGTARMIFESTWPWRYLRWIVTLNLQCMSVTRKTRPILLRLLRHVLRGKYNSPNFAFAGGFWGATKDGASVRYKLRPELWHRAVSDNRSGHQ